MLSSRPRGSAAFGRPSFPAPSAGAAFLVSLFLLASQSPPDSRAAPFAGPAGSSTWTVTADYLEHRSAEDSVLARGRVVAVSSGAYLSADEVTVFTSSRAAQARGSVRLTDGTLYALGERADYSWETGTGALHGAYIEFDPWRLWGRRIDRVSEEKYKVRRAALTNCERTPPHYHFRGRRGTYERGKRATLWGGALALGPVPVLYTPFYTRSLQDRRGSLRVEPGRDSYHGVFAKTTYHYPFTDNTYGRLKWDHYQKTGNGYGGEYHYYTPVVKGSLQGFWTEDRKAQRQRWNTSLDHWQQLKPRWTARANTLFQSDSSFSNIHLLNPLERTKQETRSNAAVTYQNPLYTANASVQQDQFFDPVRNRFLRKRTVLPRLDVNSNDLLLGRGVYARLSGNFANEYDRPESGPAVDSIFPDRDVFRQTAGASTQLSRTTSLTRKLTLTPRAGLSEQWQSWTVSSSDPSRRDRKDVFLGRPFAGAALRHRLTRSLDYDLSHTYQVRWTENTAKRDHGAADEGVETNAAAAALSYRPSPLLWVRAASGYDFRDVDNQPVRSVREKVTPPTVDVNARPWRAVSLFYRQTQALYPVRRPQSTQFSVEAGGEDLRAGSGWSYSSGRPGQVQIRHGAAFPLPGGIRLDGVYQYDLSGPRTFRYRDVRTVEQRVVVRKDLHCWIARVEFARRPGINEIFLRLDLKTNAEARRRLASPEEEQFFPSRARETP
ncbi:MAG: LPS-assembly protein LptD [Elusimicrobiota bacterium]